jgi:hypothetical protein
MDIIVLEMPDASIFRVEDPSHFSILKLVTTACSYLPDYMPSQHRSL